MKNKLKNNSTIIVIALIFVVLNVIVILSGSKRIDPPIKSTHSDNPMGVSALYKLLEQSDFDVRRHGAGFEKLPADADVLVILAPSFPTGGYGSKELRSWLEAGGTLFLAGGLSDAVWTNLDMTAGSPFEFIGLDEGKSDLADENISLSNRGGLLYGVSEIEPATWTGIADYPEKTVPLIFKHKKVIAGVTEVEEGKVYFFSTAKFLSNQNIGKADNSRLVFNLFEEFGKESVIYFDEFHHGFSDSGEGPVFNLFTAIFMRPYGLFMLQLLLAAILLLLNRNGIRIITGRRQPLSASPLVFAEAASQLHARTGSCRESVLDILGMFDRELARRFGAGSGSGIHAAMRHESEGSDLHRLLDSLQKTRKEILEGANPSAARAVEISRDIETARNLIREGSIR